MQDAHFHIPQDHLHQVLLLQGGETLEDALEDGLAGVVVTGAHQLVQQRVNLRTPVSPSSSLSKGNPSIL